MTPWTYGTPDGGCRLHKVPGVEWSDEYRCAVCGCGGSAHGLYHDPDVKSEKVVPGQPLYCWEHRPAPMTLGLA